MSNSSDKLSKEQKLAFLETCTEEFKRLNPSWFPGYIEPMEKLLTDPKHRGLDSCYGDMKEMLSGLSGAQRVSFSSRLKQRSGLTLDDLDLNRITKIAKIVDSGAIRTDDQWRLIESRVDELCQSGGSGKDIESLNKLIGAYEAKKRSRHAKVRDKNLPK